MKKLYTLIISTLIISASFADPYYTYNPTNKLYYQLSPAQYYRIDYQWYLKNTGQGSALYNNNKLTSTDPGGTYDIAYEQALPLMPTNLVKFGIIDTGIKTNHSDFNGVIFKGKNFILGQDVNDLSDSTGHGTLNAGVMFAKKNNIGLKGILDVSEAIICKTLLTRSYEIVNAVYFCITNDVKIINLSYGSSAVDLTLKTALLYAQSSNVVIVCSAPNAERDVDVIADYPASWRLDNVVIVTSITREGSKYVPAAVGKNTVHLGAPGRVIPTTGSTIDYVYESGTSLAAPFVSSAMTLIASKFPNQNYKYWIERLVSGVTKNPSLDNTISGGSLNLYNSLQEDKPVVRIYRENGKVLLKIAGYSNARYCVQKTIDFVNWDAYAIVDMCQADTLDIDTTNTPGFFRAFLY